MTPATLESFERSLLELESNHPSRTVLRCRGAGDADPKLQHEHSWRLGCPDTSPHVARLSSALAHTSFLRELDLSGCGVRCRGVAVLAPSLPRQLEALNLAANYVAHPGCAALAQALSGSKLRQLLLGSNRIDDEAAIELSTCLGSCKRLELLDLSSNEIEEDGAMDVAAQLQLCPSLQSLNLSNNAIGSAAARTLGNLISRGRLKQLDLRYNALGSLGAGEIELGLAASGHTCGVNLGYNIMVVSRHDPPEAQLATQRGTISRYGFSAVASRLQSRMGTFSEEQEQEEQEQEEQEQEQEQGDGSLEPSDLSDTGEEEEEEFEVYMESQQLGATPVAILDLS